jgi:excisionase family DNA binding protein
MEPLGVTPEAAKLAVGCGTTKLYELINSGELETYKIGRATRVTTASIKALIDRLLADQRKAA